MNLNEIAEHNQRVADSKDSFVEVVRLALPPGVTFGMRRKATDDAYELTFTRVEDCAGGPYTHRISVDVTGSQLAETPREEHPKLFMRVAQGAIRNLGGV